MSSNSTPSSASPDVSVVVVNWNTRELLRNCLESVFAHTRRRSFEVIVIDNASHDGSVEMVRSAFSAARLIVNGRNLGFATACNQGLRSGRGRQFLLLNSDTRLEDDAISGLSEFLDAHPETGVVGGALANADGTHQPSCGHFPTLWGSLTARLRRESRDSGPRGDFVYPFLSLSAHERPGEVDWVAGALMLAPRAVTDRVGPLDESIFLFAEEWDWCLRIRAAGWKVVYTPQVRVVHLGSGSWVSSQELLDHSRRAGIFYFYRKHYGRSRAAAMHALTAIGAAAKTLLAALACLRRDARPQATERLKNNWELLRWSLSPAALRMLSSDTLPAVPDSSIIVDTPKIAS